MTRFTPLKPSIQASTNQGFTLIELIIGGVVAFVVLMVTLGLIVEQRRLFLGDQQRIDYNQNLRIASDFIGTDVKQTGERVESGSPIPIIQLISGSNPDEPDELILQRKILEDSLEVCENIGQSDTEIVVAHSNDSDCDFSDGDGDSLDDSLGQFKEYRCDLENNAACTRGDGDNEDDYGSTGNDVISTIDDCNDECVYAYIHDPDKNRGEFFLYTDETYKLDSGETRNILKVVPLGTDGKFKYSYNDSDDPIIYILEEKKYRLCDGVLQLVINRRPDYGSDCPYPDSDPNPVRLVDGIEDFQVRVQTTSGWVTTLNKDLSNIVDFSEVESVEITLETEASDLISTPSNTLSLSTQFYPRNANSNF